MEDDQPILSFFRTTQRLRQDATTENETQANFEVETWIQQYEQLVGQLEGTRARGQEAFAEAKPCWKISQDILIRLRKLQTDQSAEHLQHRRVLFTEGDKEALERRLLEIQQTLKTARDATVSSE